MVYGSQYGDQTGLILRDSDSGDQRCLAYPVQRDEQESIAPLSLLPAMSFTPDNKEVVTTWDGKLHRVVTDGGNVNVIPLDVRRI